MFSRVYATQGQLTVDQEASSSTSPRKGTHLLYDSKTVGIVALEHVGAHKGEDGHDVVHELIGHQRTELRKEQ